VLGARAVSSTVNFVTNRRLVFESARERPVGSAAVRYSALVVLLLAANYALLLTLTSAGLALLPAKVLTEAVLFVASYELQRRVVFARPPLGRSSSQGAAAVEETSRRTTRA